MILDYIIYKLAAAKYCMLVYLLSTYLVYQEKYFFLSVCETRLNGFHPFGCFVCFSQLKGQNLKTWQSRNVLHPRSDADNPKPLVLLNRESGFKCHVKGKSFTTSHCIRTSDAPRRHHEDGGGAGIKPHWCLSPSLTWLISNYPQEASSGWGGGQAMERSDREERQTVGVCLLPGRERGAAAWLLTERRRSQGRSHWMVWLQRAPPPSHSLCWPGCRASLPWCDVYICLCFGHWCKGKSWLWGRYSTKYNLNWDLLKVLFVWVESTV